MSRRSNAARRKSASRARGKLSKKKACKKSCVRSRRKTLRRYRGIKELLSQGAADALRYLKVQQGQFSPHSSSDSSEEWLLFRGDLDMLKLLEKDPNVCYPVAKFFNDTDLNERMIFNSARECAYDLLDKPYVDPIINTMLKQLVVEDPEEADKMMSLPPQYYTAFLHIAKKFALENKQLTTIHEEPYESEDPKIATPGTTTPKNLRELILSSPRVSSDMSLASIATPSWKILVLKTSSGSDMILTPSPQRVAAPPPSPMPINLSPGEALNSKFKEFTL